MKFHRADAGVADVRRRSPHGERGLKYDLALARVRLAAVAPPTGSVD